jgi:hypothetical protein
MKPEVCSDEYQSATDSSTYLNDSVMGLHAVREGGVSNGPARYQSFRPFESRSTCHAAFLCRTPSGPVGHSSGRSAQRTHLHAWTRSDGSSAHSRRSHRFKSGPPRKSAIRKFEPSLSTVAFSRGATAGGPLLSLHELTHGSCDWLTRQAACRKMSATV